MAYAVVPRRRDIPWVLQNYGKRIRRLEVNHTDWQCGTACYSLETGLTTTASSWDVSCDDLEVCEDTIDTIGLTIGNDIQIPLGWMWVANVLAFCGADTPPLGECITWQASVDGGANDNATVPCFNSVWDGVVALHPLGSSGDENPSTLAFSALETCLGSEFSYTELLVIMLGWRPWTGATSSGGIED